MFCGGGAADYIDIKGAVLRRSDVDFFKPHGVSVVLF
jgi:hypothetical protein